MQCYISKNKIQPKEGQLPTNYHYTKEKKAAITSFVIIGFVRLSLIVALDFSATYYTKNLFEAELNRIHHDYNIEHGILYSTPFFLLVYDVICLLAYIISVTALLIRSKFDDKGLNFYHLALTVSVPTASILLHLPYIAIAYLNDANHAGSVLILYTVVTFLEFIILQFIFIQWFNLKLVENEKSQYIKCHLVSFVVIVILSLFFLYCIVGIFVCFFYYLPINHSISSTSNQIIIAYQTGLIFVGAIVAYKTIFEKRDPLVEALEKS